MSEKQKYIDFEAYEQRITGRFFDPLNFDPLKMAEVRGMM